MGQRLVSVLVLIVVAAIIGDLVINYRGTAVLINGITSFWKTGIQAAAGQQVS